MPFDLMGPLSTALAAAGATVQDVIKLNCYCAHAVDLAVQLTRFREVRDTYVNTAAPPASTLVVVRGLARPEWLIEVEAVAVVPG
jgi:2-iminobutanoate/2-iminopropanoate deaminase